ncbi:GNAT family N-acetyltransferase [Paraferrimonas haliotis]|uniref:N-acetyltransferase GCN5 n=1 Tax=Paraferrimonas haliotis TaxID=2013866 RepID=A0AA37TKZ6_9GAMM|nr:N-acetyltransferase [Paraferrimonas haliotis]GLS82423.1 N-acetyltransferase GCN5 [Paraferrimonas haliotis]
MTIIRKARRTDAQSIIAFNQAMALETEQRELAHDVISRGVETLIEQPHRGFYLVAQHDQKIVGSLMVTFEWSDWQAKDYWWIQSVYILPDYRRQGIYRQLYQQVKSLADGQAASFRLYVERDNLNAQATYQALQMAPCQYLMYEQKEES